MIPSPYAVLVTTSSRRTACIDDGWTAEEEIIEQAGAVSDQAPHQARCPELQLGLAVRRNLLAEDRGRMA
jgi:hypothetical protein